MSSAELLELAERVSAASGPDRKLDADIQRIMGRDFPVRYSGSGLCNAFTSSLDTATGLFADETFYHSGHDGAGPDVTMFYCQAIGVDIDGWPMLARRSVAPTEPLARVACALKVLAQDPAASTRPHADGTHNAGIEAASGKGSL